MYLSYQPHESIANQSQSRATYQSRTHAGLHDDIIRYISTIIYACLLNK